MFRRWLAVPVALMALAVGSMGAQAAVQFNQVVPLNVTEFNPCTGQPIAFSGTIHLLMGETASSNGGFHTFFMDNVSNVTGISADGTIYSGVGGDWAELNAVPPFPSATTATDVFGLISHGSTANFKVIATFHLTVNADGTVTSTVTDLRITCSG
jgi:hypothetical protein